MDEEQEFNITGLAYQISSAHHRFKHPVILEPIWFIPVNIK
jgi:hypothetical protein